MPEEKHHEQKPGSAGAVQYRTLGHTGEKVSAIGIGGFHIGLVKDEHESIQIVRHAIDSGINFLDNSWDYHDGKSELRMGKALCDGYRDRVFLMTKIDGRTKKSAQEQIDQSLKRLGTDHVDLLQFHEVIRAEDPARIFADGGALEAVLEAKQAGKTRYIGFTGHKEPQIHLRMLETAFQNNFLFDSVQMPLNVMDAHYDSFEKLVLPLLVKHNIGVLGMKSMAAGKVLESKVVSADECLRYALSLPTSVVITGCDSMKIVDQAIQMAENFTPLTDSERAQLLEKTSKSARLGAFEPYKTTREHDSTTEHPEWLGAA